MRGRLPKPTRLKVVQGTDRKDRTNQQEPVPPTGDPKPPAWLKGRGRRVWASLAPDLIAIGVLTVIDEQAFAVLCETQAEYIEARADVRKRGVLVERTRYTKDGMSYDESEQNPSVRIASDAGKRVKSMMAEFGITPSSRTRVKATPAKTLDPFEEWERERGNG